MSKIIGFVVVLEVAILGIVLGILCNMCDCGRNCCAAEAIPTAKHEKYQPQMGISAPLPKVNTDALFEKKGQLPPAPQTTPDAQRIAAQYGARVWPSKYGGVYATLPEGYVWEASGQRGTYSAPNVDSLARQMSRGIRPFRQPYQPPKPQPKPQPQPITGDRPLHQLERGRVLLFLDDSQRSAMLRSWFDTHEGLRQLKDECDFVTYTADDGLYKSLFASQIPVEAFPAVVVADESGAKLYGAGRDDVPDSGDGLFEAIRQGADYASSGAQTVSTGIFRKQPQCVGPDCNPNQQQPYQQPYQQPVNPPSPQYEKDNRILPREGGLVDRLKHGPEGKGGPLGGMVHQALWGWWDDIVFGLIALVIVILGYKLASRWLDIQAAKASDE